MAYKEYESTGCIEDGYYRLKKKIDLGDAYWEEGTIVYAEQNYHCYELVDKDGHRKIIRMVNEKGDYDDALTSILEKTPQIQKLEEQLQATENSDIGKKFEEKFCEKHPIRGLIAHGRCKNGIIDGEMQSLLTGFLLAMLPSLFIGILLHDYMGEYATVKTFIIIALTQILLSFILFFILDNFILDRIVRDYNLGYDTKSDMIASTRKMIWALDGEIPDRPSEEYTLDPDEYSDDIKPYVKEYNAIINKYLKNA